MNEAPRLGQTSKFQTKISSGEPEIFCFHRITSGHGRAGADTHRPQRVLFIAIADQLLSLPRICNRIIHQNMAPRAAPKRRTSDVQVQPVKKQASTNTITTKAKDAAATKRASQPLAPSTSQNSVVKSTAKHKGRKPSQSIPKDEIAVKTRKIPAPSKKVRTAVTDAETKLNVYAFGSGSMGELGLGPQSNQRNVKRPRLNPNLLPDEVGIVDIAAGGMHCAAIDGEGRVWTWGVNDQGVLGRETTWSPENEDEDMDDEDEDKLNPRESVPGLVEGFPEGTVISKIACGDSITVALTNDGKVYAWGTFRVRPSYLRG